MPRSAAEGDGARAGFSSDGGRSGCSVAAGLYGPDLGPAGPLGTGRWLDIKGTGVHCGCVRSTTVSAVEAVPSRVVAVPLTRAELLLVFGSQTS